MSQHVTRINDIKDALNYIEDGISSVQAFYDKISSWDEYLSDNLEKYQGGKKDGAKVVLKDNGVEFSKEFLENEDYVVALKGMRTIYDKMSPQDVKEMPQEKKTNLETIKQIEKDAISAVTEKDDLYNHVEKRQAQVFKTVSGVLLTGIILKNVFSSESFDWKETGAHAFIALCVGGISGLGVKSWYSSDIKEADKKSEHAVKQFAANKEEYKKLQKHERKIEKQHAENQDILETKERANKVFKALDAKL